MDLSQAVPREREWVTRANGLLAYAIIVCPRVPAWRHGWRWWMAAPLALVGVMLQACAEMIAGGEFWW